MILIVDFSYGSIFINISGAIFFPSVQCRHYTEKLYELQLGMNATIELL